MSEPLPSVGALSAPLVNALVRDAENLRIGVQRMEEGVCLVDAGIEAIGGLEAGRRIAEICMGGLGRVSLQASTTFPPWSTALHISTSHPVLACLGSQLAGWSLSESDFSALGSGPGRAAAGKEQFFEEIAYHDRVENACLVLEVDRQPPLRLARRIADECGVLPERLTLILTPTQSLAGTVQIVARVLEVALHKAHALRFPLERIIDGTGTAPLPPPGADFLSAMGRTNDATLYGGDVHLYVSGDEEEAASLARQLPSSASRDHGRTFADIFDSYGGDFYAMDPMLFSPARVTVTALETGRSITAGEFDRHLIARSFGGE